VFVRTKNYDLLAGILLAITGCEALFAKYVLLAIYAVNTAEPDLLVWVNSTCCLFSSRLLRSHILHCKSNFFSTWCIVNISSLLPAASRTLDKALASSAMARLCFRTSFISLFLASSKALYSGPLQEASGYRALD
jgi:hypothetical protein